MNPITRHEVPTNRTESKTNPDNERDFRKLYEEASEEEVYV